jgi:protein-tyrosine phosphatase
MRTHDRRVPLEGAVNFRDLGGYPTTDNRRVRWRLLYRSDSLAELTDLDLEAVSALGLRTLCDLRDTEERSVKPNRRPPGELGVHDIGFTPYGAATLYSGVRRMTVQEIEGRVREVYRRFVTDHTQPFARLLDILTQPEALPAIMHCTSGRDRTGFAALVVLEALGVPRETIATDYMLSAEFRRDLRFQIGNDVAHAQVAALTEPSPSYLDAAYEAIDETWGSVDAFLAQGLGLTDDRRARLQELLLEPDVAAAG